ncbi:DNA adenine methylase [Listeria monocytogenes]|nr:DNA adenine methylase [Listeria monocytogenes]
MGIIFNFNWSEKRKEIIKRCQKEQKQLKDMKDAQIENMDAIKLIEQHNDKDTLIYCDPPYVHSSLVDRHYEHDFSLEQHRELLSVLKRHKGYVMISGYESELYNLELSMWPQIKKQVKVGITTKKKSNRQEIIWCNFDPPMQLNLFYDEGEMEK